MEATMAAVEEHKPVEKRRALGRGLDSLLPSGPRVVSSAVGTEVTPARTEPALSPPKGMPEPHVPVVPPPLVIPTKSAAAPEVAPNPGSERASLEARPYMVAAAAHGGEVAALHAGGEKSGRAVARARHGLGG